MTTHSLSACLSSLQAIHSCCHLRCVFQIRRDYGDIGIDVLLTGCQSKLSLFHLNLKLIIQLGVLTKQSSYHSGSVNTLIMEKGLEEVKKNIETNGVMIPACFLICLIRREEEEEESLYTRRVIGSIPWVVVLYLLLPVLRFTLSLSLSICLSLSHSVSGCVRVCLGVSVSHTHTPTHKYAHHTHNKSTAIVN